MPWNLCRKGGARRIRAWACLQDPRLDSRRRVGVEWPGIYRLSWIIRFVRLAGAIWVFLKRIFFREASYEFPLEQGDLKTKKTEFGKDLMPSAKNSSEVSMSGFNFIAAEAHGRGGKGCISLDFNDLDHFPKDRYQPGPH